MSTRPITLMETMKEIRDKIAKEQQPYSYRQPIKPVGDAIITKSQVYPNDITYSQVMKQSIRQSGIGSSQADEETRLKVSVLEQDTAISQKTIKQLVDHVNKHMKKLSDAVMTLQDEVVNLKVENAAMKEFIIKTLTEGAIENYGSGNPELDQQHQRDACECENCDDDCCGKDQGCYCCCEDEEEQECECDHCECDACH